MLDQWLAEETSWQQLVLEPVAKNMISYQMGVD